MMRTATLRTSATWLLVGCVAAPMAEAQWGVSLEARRVVFGGTSVDTTAGNDRQSFRPTASMVYGLRLDRRVGRTSVALAARLATAGLVLRRADAFAGLSGEFLVFEAAPEAVYRLATTRSGARLHAYAGPVIGLWLFGGENARAVPGAAAGLIGEFGLTGRLTLWLRGGGALTRSVFERAELPPEFLLRATRRGEIAIGLRYGR
ncbi:MAG: hypothetical protein ACREMF_05235 [Gemmatimonadales bacterium]